MFLRYPQEKVALTFTTAYAYYPMYAPLIALPYYHSISYFRLTGIDSKQPVKNSCSEIKLSANCSRDIDHVFWRYNDLTWFIEAGYVTFVKESNTKTG